MQSVYGDHDHDQHSSTIITARLLAVTRSSVYHGQKFGGRGARGARVAAPKLVCSGGSEVGAGYIFA